MKSSPTQPNLLKIGINFKCMNIYVPMIELVNTVYFFFPVPLNENCLQLFAGKERLIVYFTGSDENLTSSWN